MPAVVPAESEPRSVPGCPTDDALLSYIPGLLSDEDAAVVLAHLQDCSSCQSRVTVLRKRLSSEGHGRAESPTTTVRQTEVTPGDELRENQAGGRKQAAPTLAYVPKRRSVPDKIGQYEVLGPLGRGGMGVVYKGYHPRLQRHVAIKLLHGLHLADNTAIIRLQREQAAAGRVEHENIVYAFDAGEQDGVDYLVMEYVEGVDLARLITVCGTLPVADACEIIRQAALGLGHIEACGLVHRDIKPSNLMLSTQGVVKILDLGLARLREGPIDEEEATHSGFLLGTADYMSPEQIDTPREADVRSDLYSLGCALFKLLAGHAPFSDREHSSYSQKLDAHRREPPPPIRSLRLEVPEAIDQLLARLLAKDPADRPQHPDDVSAALAPFAAGANLRVLVRRAPPTAEPEPALSGAEPTPSAVSESTKPHSQTPSQQTDSAPIQQERAKTAGRRVMVGLALAGLIAVSGVIATALGGFGRGGGARENKVSTIDRHGLAGGGQTIAGSGQTKFDLRQQLHELKWEGHISSPPPFFNDNQQMLEVRPDSYQFLAVGNYDGQPGAFEITIRQSPWHGDAGLFFGYRHEPRLGYNQLAVFQVVRLWHYPIANARGELLRKELQLVRERGIIRLNPIHLEEEDFVRKLVAYPKAQDVRLRVEFGDKRVKGIFLDGVELPELCTPAANGQFTDRDHVGLFGLYSAVSENDTGPTLFGNFVFTPSETAP
jgi:serine/threonine protein kinase